MSLLNNQQKMYYTLRLAVAMCFIGHGAFGIITKPIWCNYFAVFGIGHETAYRLMPMLGLFDILMGIGMLLYPIRAIPFWLLIWGVLTAGLRPLSGEPVAEFIERAGNFGAPLALLILTGSFNMKKLFATLDNNPAPEAKSWARVLFCLRITAFLLLAGHGWLNLTGKKSLLAQYSSLGLSNPVHSAFMIGSFEMIAAFLVLIHPTRPLIFILVIWKITNELFYPHYALFEWIERGGSYGVLLALWFALAASSAKAALRNRLFGAISHTV